MNIKFSNFETGKTVLETNIVPCNIPSNDEWLKEIEKSLNAIDNAQSEDDIPSNVYNVLEDIGNILKDILSENRTDNK